MKSGPNNHVSKVRVQIPGEPREREFTLQRDGLHTRLVNPRGRSREKALEYCIKFEFLAGLKCLPSSRPRTGAGSPAEQCDLLAADLLFLKDQLERGAVTGAQIAAALEQLRATERTLRGIIKEE